VHPLTHPLRGRRRPLPAVHTAGSWLRLNGCRANNLRGIDVAIPLGRLTVITGVSGSGKSSLLHGCLAAAAAAAQAKGAASRAAARELPLDRCTGFEAIRHTYEVDQSPIGKTSRSCPATYVGVFDEIRRVFALLPEARIHGYEISRFSFNTEGGRCPECKGNGRIRLEMDFLPTTWVHCEACNGQRYNPRTLEVEYRGRTIADVLDMTIDEAAAFFDPHPRIAATLRLLADTGLGYLQLGQPSPTLSGGEAQRLKLVTELVRGRPPREALRTTRAVARNNLYLIEEPTVGLHHQDVRRLIEVLHRLVDEGHTVVVIEHHMAVAAEADFLVDLGPDAGASGGRIVARGTPEQVARKKTSRTAPFLAAQLQRR
jgi:excinuclease ABC subunit A